MAGQSQFARVQRAALAASVPLTVHLEITHDCNLSCGFCCNPRHPALRPLDLATWTVVLDDLRELGTLNVAVTGGEPLLHPDFMGIARAARQRRFALRILSNGTLIDDTLAGDIAELHPLAVEVSIHGADASTHDRTTGAPGSYRAAWQGIARLHERGVRVVVKTPVTRLNASQVDAIVERSRQHGLAVRLDPTITPRDDGCQTPLAYAAARTTLREVMARVDADPLPALDRRPGEANCGVGRLTLTVDPAGEVYPCIQWRTSSLGNVGTQRLREIWPASTERRRVAAVAEAANDRLLELGGACAAHPYCPAVAARTTGDPLQPDAVFLSQAEIARSLREGP